MSQLNLNFFTCSTKTRQIINKIIHKPQLHHKFWLKRKLVNKHPKLAEPAERITPEEESGGEKCVWQRIEYKANKEDPIHGGKYWG